MRPLYLTDPVRCGLGDFLRPGGERLTERTLQIVVPGYDWSILDAGCGPGGTIGYLQNCGFSDITGLDVEYSLLRQASLAGRKTVLGSLEHMPFAAGSFDLVLSECAWNLTDRIHTLEQFGQVLKTGGILALSDIYLLENRAEENDWPPGSCFSKATTLGRVIELVESHGFVVTLVEDQSRLLKQAAAAFVFAHGSLKQFWLSVTGDERCADTVCRTVAACRPGLFLLVAEKKRHE